MNRQRIAQELLAVARDIVGAVRDLADVRGIMPEMKTKLDEYNRKREEQQREMNRMYHEATKDVSEGTKDLSSQIGKALVDYFKANGMGIRKTDIGDSLVEVFIGSDDGVDRVQGKVSTHITLTTGRNPSATYMLRNEESMNDVRGNLADKGTISKLIQVVKKADKKDFWSEGR